MSKTNFSGIGNHSAEPKTGYFTGLAPVLPIIANPTMKQYKDITGRDAPYELNYERREIPNNNGGKTLTQPISVLVKNSKNENFYFLKFYITNEDETSRNGSLRFINALGRFSYSESAEKLKENSKMDWFTSCHYESIKSGMEPMHNFLQKLLNFDSGSPTWLSDMEKNNISFENLYKGDVSGLNTLFEWACKENGYHVVCLHTVKRKENDNGDVKNIQVLESGKPNLPLFFSFRLQDDTPIVHERAFLDFRKLERDRKSNDLVITKNFYSYEFMPFDEANCVNGTVSTPSKEAVPTSNPKGMDDVV